MEQTSELFRKEKKSIGLIIIRSIIPVICFSIFIYVGIHWFAALIVAGLLYEISISRQNESYCTKLIVAMQGDVKDAMVDKDEIENIIDSKKLDHGLLMDGIEELIDSKISDHEQYNHDH